MVVHVRCEEGLMRIMNNKMVCSKENLIEELMKRKPEVLITIGAGDIDQLVEPIENSLRKIFKTAKKES